jgi:hypothetical protein
MQELHFVSSVSENQISVKQFAGNSSIITVPNITTVSGFD